MPKEKTRWPQKQKRLHPWAVARTAACCVCRGASVPHLWRLCYTPKVTSPPKVAQATKRGTSLALTCRSSPFGVETACHASARGGGALAVVGGANRMWSLMSEAPGGKIRVGVSDRTSSGAGGQLHLSSTSTTPPSNEAPLPPSHLCVRWRRLCLPLPSRPPRRRLRRSSPQARSAARQSPPRAR